MQIPLTIKPLLGFISNMIIDSVNECPQQEEEVRTLCEQCGVEKQGAKMELVVRLWKQMSNRAIYNKLFEKVSGASGE